MLCTLTMVENFTAQLFVAGAASTESTPYIDLQQRRDSEGMSND